MTIVESYFVPTDSKCDILLNVKDLGITQYVFTLSSHCEHFTTIKYLCNEEMCFQYSNP